MKKIFTFLFVHSDTLVRFLYTRCWGVRTILHWIRKRAYVSKAHDYFTNLFDLITADLSRYSIEWKGKRILEVGPGSKQTMGYAFLLNGADEYIFADPYFRFNGAVNEEAKKYVEDYYGGQVNLDKAVVAPNAAENLKDVLPNSIDLYLSVSVYEHIVDIQAAIKEIARVLKPGGVAYCSVDLRDHYHFPQPFRFLRYSDFFYKHFLTATGYSYTNRLRPSHYKKAIEAAGLGIIDFRVKIADAALPKKIARSLQNLPQDDLKARHLVFVVSK